jgi:hypothetical protein
MLIFRKIINKNKISFTAIKFDKNCYFIERERATVTAIDWCEAALIDYVIAGNIASF